MKYCFKTISNLCPCLIGSKLVWIQFQTELSSDSKPNRIQFELTVRNPKEIKIKIIIIIEPVIFGSERPKMDTRLRPGPSNMPRGLTTASIKGLTGRVQAEKVLSNELGDLRGSNPEPKSQSETSLLFHSFSFKEKPKKGKGREAAKRPNKTKPPCHRPRAAAAA